MQDPLLLEDLAVYFCQEEFVCLCPAHRPPCNDPMQAGLEDVTSWREAGGTEESQKFSQDFLEMEELALGKCSMAVPTVFKPGNSSEDEEGHPGKKKSGGTFTQEKKLINLLVTIENHLPLVELSQCLEIRAFSEILEEATELSTCPECNKSFNDKPCLVLHEKIHPGGKQQRCGH